VVKLRQAGGRAILLATGALVVAAVAACGGSPTASGSSAGSASAEAPATSQDQAGAGQPATAKAPQNGGACKAADLKAALGSKQEVPTDVQGQLGAAGTHYKVDLVWTNHSGHACTMQGFGGVDVVGPNQGADHPTFSLPRMGDTPAVVKLAAGGTAHTTITYIDPSGAQPASQSALWTPTHLSVTPPNETAHLTVPWTLGTPFYQDAEAGLAAAGISSVTAGS
jgi:uncharacterized protein DUF4232